MGGLRATIDLAPIGIAHFDTEGRFLLVNRHLCALLGYARDELLKRTFQGLTHSDDLESCAALNAQLAAGTIGEYRQARRFVRRDGSILWARVMVSAVRDEDDEEVAFFIGVVEDITEERKRDEAVRGAWEREQQAHAQTVRAKQWREEMVAVVSHDLRNPLQTISLGTALLALPHLSAEQHARQLELVRRTTRSMERLISDLLDVTRIDAGSFVIAYQAVDVRTLLEEMCEQFESVAAERELSLAWEAPPVLPRVIGDRARLGQVLSNLLGNAFKFTPAHGHVTVRAGVQAQMLEISVQDTGPGVTAEQLPHLFDRFWQADRSSGSGVGLGLAISKGIVEAHGGRIRAESVCGQGTCISFTLPVA